LPSSNCVELTQAPAVEASAEAERMILQSDADLRRHLDEQVGFLQASACSYDGGVVAEAKRLALSVRILVHETGKSKSLLTQLKMKDRPFVDSTSERPSRTVSSYAGLVGIRLEPGPHRYVPSLNTWMARPVSFDQWWNGVIVADLRRREISRRRLILAIANQDGGAHVDPELSEIYAELSRTNSMGHTHSVGDVEHPLLGVDHASVRQVAHEVLATLERGQPLQPVERGEVTVHGPTVSLAARTLRLVRVKVGRNARCPCGSGRKYKRCCGLA
jgi:hypothetical protein